MAIRLGSICWIIGCIFTGSFIAATVYLRLNDMNYAEAVSRIDYQFCQSRAVDKAPNCGANAQETYILMDPGIKKALGPAAVAAFLVWIFSSLAITGLVVAARMIRTLSSRARLKSEI